MTGIDFPTQGVININGTEIGQMNENKLAQWRGKNVEIVFQLIPTLTISENLLLAMEFVNVIPKPDRVQRVKDVLIVMSDTERVKVIYDHLNIILSTIVILSFLVLMVSVIGDGFCHRNKHW